tara:strand:- start:219 stop:875 length:657 start_codon:yes stop_codon:yes gene_type:complete
MNKWLIENQFYLTSDKSRIQKLVDHYEIYKKISQLNGDIIECGVFKGVSLIRFLTFRDIDKNTKTKKIYGFDAFGRFPKPVSNKDHRKRDTNFAKLHDTKIGIGINIKKLDNLLKKKDFKNYELVKGDVTKTIDQFVNKKKNLKISLLHLDMDIYTPTKYTLNKLYKFIVKKGIILIDDYKHIKGATMAINEFLNENKKLKIQKISSTSRPSFIIKDD